MNQNTNNNGNKGNGLGGFIVIGIIIFIIFSMINSSKKDAELRKQETLKDFETQMQKDPSTWTKEERQLYDDFTKWDMQNER